MTRHMKLEIFLKTSDKYRYCLVDDFNMVVLSWSEGQ